MAPSSASGELWGYHLMPQELTVDILLPNGLIIPVLCYRDHTLRTIKQNLWKEAKRYPLFGLLQSPSTYSFVAVVQEGEREELFDESRRLCELRLFWPVLSLIEPVGNRDEKSLSYEIGLLLGRPLCEFDDARDPEIVQCRLDFLNTCQLNVQERTAKHDGMDFYTIVCDTVNIQQAPKVHDILISIWTDCDSVDADRILRERRRGGQKLTLKMDGACTPIDVIREAVMRRSRKLTSNGYSDMCYRATEIVDGDNLVGSSRPISQAFLDGSDVPVDQFVLKVAGCHLYLLQETSLVNYLYVQQCLQTSKRPQVMIISRQALLESAKSWEFVTPSFVKRQASLLAASNRPLTNADGWPLKTLWEVHNMVKLKVISASYINISDMDKIYVRAGIYHGAEPLCIKDTAAVPCSDPRWNELIEFGLYIPDIPHGAQICFALCSIKQKKQKDEHFPLAWANLRLLDYKDVLLSGKLSLHLWSFPKSFDGFLNFLGQCGSNPNRDMPCLEIEFETFTSGPIIFPPRGQIDQYVQFVLDSNKQRNPAKLAVETEVATASDKKLFDDIIHRDPLHEMSEEEKEAMWRLRKYCQLIPDALPRLLDAIRWSSREEVSQMYVLLDVWRGVRPETAMELLDIKYPDPSVRKFAVNSLDKNLTDEQLLLYLFSLVQVLKYEPYLNNDLSKFLLKRALRNQKVGRLFFWLLRSELVHSSTWIRFGLLLEAYCRGCGHFLKTLLKQVDATDKLALLTNTLKERKEDSSKMLIEQINVPDFLDALQNIESPLDSSVMLGELRQEECRIITSAKRPLWLVWKNPDPLAELSSATNEILFKSGDDLRQDMLTLQVLKIMDTIWKADGKDLCLTPYACLPMGKHIGMIEIVKRSKTILEIQLSQGKIGALNIGSSSLLHKWLKLHNKGEKYEQAVEKFTRSCAGYCVATFVLGIRDRHQSNIMITEDGRIFHIDFGHFLGHYKKKFGINRERVPFVLTEDFIRVIAKGGDNPRRSKEFERFQQLCGEAYLILHRHAHLFITLFTMMLCMSIPELQKLEDIHYLRRTLAVDKKDEQQALQYFNEQLNEAYEGGWTTKVDWFFHSVRHIK